MLKRAGISFMVVIFLLESLIPGNKGIAEIPKLGSTYIHFATCHKSGESLLSLFWLHFSKSSGHKQRPEHQNLPSFDTGSTYYIAPLVKYYVKFDSIILSGKKYIRNYRFLDNYFFVFFRKMIQPPAFRFDVFYA